LGVRLKEALKSKLRCWSFYYYGCYRGTGGRLRYIAPDWREVRLDVPLSRRTRNYVGTIFGGSMFGATDPIYMLMLIKRLGSEFVVWDKAATVRFKSPGRSTLHASFVIPDEDVADIRAALREKWATERTYTVELVDGTGTICAVIEKVIHIRRR
jgi:acyl-coenzyme A thioesterase PaaI-like protein